MADIRDIVRCEVKSCVTLLKMNQNSHFFADSINNGLKQGAKKYLKYHLIFDTEIFPNYVIFGTDI